MGSHKSYHRDGNIFRTSPGTEGQPKLLGDHIPLADFRGWYQLGIGMITRNQISSNPCVKARDRKSENVLTEVSLESYPSETINIVAELLEAEERELLGVQSLAPPLNGTLHLLQFDRL